MALNNRKKKELYEFYSEHGFHHSTDTIVDQLNICHKTFFNRYGSKSNSMEIAWLYWQETCKKKWEGLIAKCNHSVEELTMTLYHIDQFRFEEPHYYEYTRSGRKYLDSDSFFYKSIHEILERGKQCFHIEKNLNIPLYTTFVLNNLFLIDIEYENRPHIIQYILRPALTERGMELLMETPFT